MKNMKKYIAKKTEKIRYKMASFIMKRLTPVLWKKIDISVLADQIHRTFKYKTDNFSIETRPFVEFMKERFNGRLVKGAELGVKRGGNSKSILKELNIGKLCLIDLWENYEGIDDIWSNIDKSYKYVLSILGEDKRVRIIKDFCEVAVNDIEDDSLDFIYIDANHKYEYVYQDINLWFPKVKKGGFIGGHDICTTGVLKAVKEFCSKKNIKFQTEIPDWYFCKI